VTVHNYSAKRLRLSARIRRAGEVVRILSPWTGRIGGKVAAATCVEDIFLDMISS
jgi:hypothetical protein